jgi:hypothetical protein
MKLPLDQVLVDTDDAPAKDETGKEVTLRAALIRAVLSEFDGDHQPVKGVAKLARYDLFKRIKRAADGADFSPEDVVDLRKAVLIYPPLTCGQIHDLLS